jgi:hypothetical protein
MVMSSSSTATDRFVEPESYPRIVSVPFVLLVLLAVLGVRLAPRPTAPKPRAVRVIAAPPPAVPAPPVPVVVEPPAPPPPPRPDRAAIVRAEDALEAARRDRLRAEERARAAADALAAASLRSAAGAWAEKGLAATLRDPSARIARATARGAFFRAQRDRLKDEVAALARTPKPRHALPIDPSPVAIVTEGEEFHFEVRRDRVAFIDLERLLEKAKADARLRLRLAQGGAPIAATVGPVGPFSLQYEMGRTLADSIGELIDPRGPTYSLLGFEVIPEHDLRGETFDVALRPASDFSRAINRLGHPAKSTLTLWVYPDGFALYRRLRDHLHARGFLVAARPLPFGIPIRGSPAGSFSAGQ